MATQQPGATQFAVHSAARLLPCTSSSFASLVYKTSGALCCTAELGLSMSTACRFRPTPSWHKTSCKKDHSWNKTPLVQQSQFSSRISDPIFYSVIACMRRQWAAADQAPAGRGMTSCARCAVTKSWQRVLAGRRNGTDHGETADSAHIQPCTTSRCCTDPRLTADKPISARPVPACLPALSAHHASKVPILWHKNSHWHSQIQVQILSTAVRHFFCPKYTSTTLEASSRKTKDRATQPSTPALSSTYSTCISSRLRPCSLLPWQRRRTQSVYSKMCCGRAPNPSQELRLHPI